MSEQFTINAMKRFVLLLFALLCINVTNAGEYYGQNHRNGYRGYVELGLGDAYNFNTSQLVSTNNMQFYSMISTTHGYEIKNWFVGGGVGYYHSFRDEENIFPIYAAGRYTFNNTRLKPYIETRAGIVYDPKWVKPVQAYGALSGGVNVYKRFQAGLRLSLFSRPSRYFTANAAVVISYRFGK